MPAVPVSLVAVYPVLSVSYKYADAAPPIDFEVNGLLSPQMADMSRFSDNLAIAKTGEVEPISRITCHIKVVDAERDDIMKEMRSL